MSSLRKRRRQLIVRSLKQPEPLFVLNAGEVREALEAVRR